MSPKEPTTQILLFSQPRTGCHLLERMLSKQSRIHTYLQHPFGISSRYPRAWLLAEPLVQISAELSQKHDAQMQKGEKRWRKGLATTESKNKALYVHFHPLFALKPDVVYDYLSNGPAVAPRSIRKPLSVPDELLLMKGTVPLLTIRNPRLQVPSLYRVSRDTLPGGVGGVDLLASATPRWNRLLHDWYTANGIQPLVVDADDYMSSEAFVRHLCSISGLDPDEALIKWDKTNRDMDMNQYEKNHSAIQKTLFASQGPEARRASQNVDLDAEERGWDAEFGVQGARLVRETVQTVSGDYEYLRERRVRLPGSKL
ncbi:hypothetical protein PRZ48_014242 [Zasmidium cellare]|uniref:Sulfotransferase n=1 Tax=Zasmidium cellare TaxID=395010 RepID=A0ABR0E0W8_ZASCE|nr:hypothetical protein PRZ48_014242 [Zasmidium cellare]